MISQKLSSDWKSPLSNVQAKNFLFKLKPTNFCMLIYNLIKMKVKVSLNYQLKHDQRSKLNFFKQYHLKKLWIEFHHNLNPNQILTPTKLIWTPTKLNPPLKTSLTQFNLTLNPTWLWFQLARQDFILFIISSLNQLKNINPNQPQIKLNSTQLKVTKPKAKSQPQPNPNPNKPEPNWNNQTKP